MSRLNKISLTTFFFGSILYGISFFWLDQPIANIFHYLSHNTDLYTFYDSITLLGDPKFSIGFVAVSLVFSIGILIKQPQNQFANILLIMCLAMIAAIFAETALKFLLARYRPELLFKDGLYGFHYLSSEHALNSTPSGHATRAFVFVTGLSLAWKRLTPLFVLIGLSVCLSRLALEFHYLSDVLFGAFLGTFVTLYVAKVYNAMTLSNQSYASLRLR